MEKNMSLKQRIENALHQRNGFRYNHPDWNKKLWNKSAQDIREYIWDRFNTTLDIEEYYSCMTLLYRTMPNSELLVEFKNSPQYQKKMGISMDQKESSERIKTGSKLDIIEPILSKTITVLGE